VQQTLKERATVITENEAICLEDLTLSVDAHLINGERITIAYFTPKRDLCDDASSVRKNRLQSNKKDLGSKNRLPYKSKHSSASD
jgi:hypothetical protein